jgi:hypothetical protein
MSNNKPTQTLRDGALKATIWENRTRDGKSFYSTQFGKTYEDANGQLKDSNNFSGTDLLRLSELARKAYAVEGTLRNEVNQADSHKERPQRRSRSQDYDR